MSNKMSVISGHFSDGHSLV